MSSQTMNLRQIYTVAASQDGVISRRQLLDIGFSKHAIDRRIRTGMLLRVHAGVYQVGPVSGRFAAERAALLACRGGVISHATAARIHELQFTGARRDVIDVTLPEISHARRRKGILAHRRALAPDEITITEGVAITTIPRTLLDLASVAGADVGRAFGRAESCNPSIHQQLQDLLTRHPHAAGAPRLRGVIDDPVASSFTRSAAEVQLLELIKSAGLSRPHVNIRVAGYEVDFYWRRAGLIVEVDGYEFHSSKRAFVRDRQRDSALAAAGFRVMRLSWHQLTMERDRTLVQLAWALGRKAA